MQVALTFNIFHLAAFILAAGMVGYLIRPFVDDWRERRLLASIREALEADAEYLKRFEE